MRRGRAISAKALMDFACFVTNLTTKDLFVGGVVVFVSDMSGY